jgi:hypothetical protein
VAINPPVLNDPGKHDTQMKLESLKMTALNPALHIGGAIVGD